MAIQKNVASQKLPVYAINNTTGAPVTGDAANITASISKDGAAFAALSDVNPVEMSAALAPGMYLFDLAQEETNCDLLVFTALSSTPDVKLAPLSIYTSPSDSLTGIGGGGADGSLYCAISDVTGPAAEFSIPSGLTDDEVNMLILRSSQMIDLFTGQHFGYTPLTILVSGTGTKLLRTASVLSWRIVSISSVYTRDEYGDAFSEEVETDDYTVSQSRKGLLRVDGETWEEGDKNYRVIGYFGRRFVPELVKYACVLLTRHIITPGSVSRYEQLQSESYGDGYSYTRKASSSAPQSSRRSTGVPYVDTLLSCYVIDKPIFAVPGK